MLLYYIGVYRIELSVIHLICVNVNMNENGFVKYTYYTQTYWMANEQWHRSHDYSVHT